jgi:hypothetical protein
VRWIGHWADVVLACCGVIILLYGYRVLGKPPGTDEKYDAAMARQVPVFKIMGSIIILMALVGLLDRLVGGLSL